MKKLTITTLITSMIIFYPLFSEGIEGHIGAHPSVSPVDNGSGLYRDDISDDEQERWNGPHLIERELLIKFRTKPLDSTSSKASLQIPGKALGKIKIEELFPEKPGHYPSNRPAAMARSFSKDELSRWYKVTLPEGLAAEDFLKAYENHPDIEYVEPNYVYSINAIPNDRYHDSKGIIGSSYEDLWGLYKVSAPDSWDIETGSQDIIVAVVDTGLDRTHGDIANNLWTNQAEIAGNYIDDDNNGYVDDINGWNFVDLSGNLSDGHGHGTHVSGIIAAEGNNSIGISGVCWSGRIMALRGLNDDGYGLTGDLAKGIRYAVDHGARIINMSWGGRNVSKLVTEALDYAYEQGCVLVVAAGNSSDDASEFFPANYENAITVGATDVDDRKASFSNYGDMVDVTAPGYNILSLRASGTDMYNDGSHTVDEYYYKASGTSMATPFVSGLAALILSRNPNLTREDVELAIISSVDDIGAVGKDSSFGYGRINAYKALETVNGNLPALEEIGAYDTPGDSGGHITVFWSEGSLPSGVSGYRIYYSRTPFKSIYEEGVSYFEGSPDQRSDVLSCVVDSLGSDDTGYYFAVIASLFDSLPESSGGTVSQASSSDYISTIQPVYTVDNIVDTTEGSDVIIAGTDPQTMVIIPQGSNNGKIVDVVIPDADSRYLHTGSSRSQSESDSSDYLDPQTLESTKRTFSSSESLTGAVEIAISYPEDVPLSYEEKLRIYKLNASSGEWNMLSGEHAINKSENVVMITTSASDWNDPVTYRLFVHLFAASDLAQINIYPNPYKPNSGLGHTNITFDNLTQNAKIRVFNIAGELVRTMKEDDSDGRYEWNATNGSNERLASGVYIYLITDDTGAKKTGKLAIIR
ncbi:MAG: S8 family serine peptidase [bacterium]